MPEVIETGPFKGKMGEPREVVESQEPWTQVSLDDGTVIRFKIVVSDIHRVVDEFDPEGNPSYTFRVQPVITVRVPQHLKQKAKE